MRIRVISVTYRAADAIAGWADALESAWQARVPAHGDRLVVLAVDNASPEDTVQLLRAREPFVTLLAQLENRGFAAGCNAGLRTAEPGEIVIVMNPDVEVAEDFFAVLGTLDWPPELALRGPCVIGREGAVEQSARAFPSLLTGLLGRTSVLARLFPDSAPVRRQLLARPGSGAADVDWISGVCMVGPYARWVAVGPFDEGYFMYWEDADWCRRAHDRGLRIRYDPALRVRHHQGSSSAYRPLGTILAFHFSAWRYHRSHAETGLAVDGTAAVGLALRAVFKIAASLANRVRRGGGGRSRRRSRRS